MRSTRAVIHTDNFRNNIQLVRKQVGESRLICAAVKADGYGHGALEMTKIAMEEGVSFFAVATAGEGVLLRKQGLKAPVILLTLANPQELKDMVNYDIQPFVADKPYLDLINKEAVSRGKTCSVHLHIDTGMGRVGCAPEDAPGLAEYINNLTNVRLAGVSTHFACADSKDRQFTIGQLSLFKNAVDSIRKAGIDPGIVHASNSAAILEYPDAWIDMVRPGIMLYGYYPGNETPRLLPLKPVMELKSRVVFLKRVPAGQTLSYGATYTTKEETFIATIPVGYGDGYNRLLSSRGKVIIRGREYTISGRVCMDQCMVDLGPRTDVELYDDVILFGPDPAGPSAEDIAGTTGTISYEVTCAVNKRVPRIYLEET